MDVAIHANPALAHQREYAEWLRQGFARHSLKATITASRTKESDIHVIIGPWYAKQQWLGHPRVLLVDRCFYKGDPDHVSIGWMNERGGRRYTKGDGKDRPVIKRNDVNERKVIFLADYGQASAGADYDTFRRHPGDDERGLSLYEQLRSHSCAKGNKTTALVTAALMGLEVHSSDPDHILNQPDWQGLLPYADWHYSEIQSGEAWEHLRSSLPQQQSR